MSDSEEETFDSDSIGSRLKAAREAQGMSLDDVAAKTRVPIRHLHHMEKGEWDELPATTYCVGFARAYATVVGLSPAEIGGELRAQLGAPKPAAPTSYYEPADPARVPPRWLALVALVIALLLVGGYIYWRSGAVDDSGVDEGQIAMETQPQSPAPLVQPKAAAPAPSSGPVVLTATSDVWLRVYEPGGRKLFENMLKTGEHFEVPPTATRPQILTGRPNALNVTIAGRPIPPLGSPEKTIADVSLLPADLLARAAPAAAAPPTH
jgi:cytoskeletal protein RodZ